MPPVFTGPKSAGGCAQENEARGADGLSETRKAFEYCLERVGQAAGAGPLWLQYLSLLQRPRPGTADFAALFGSPPAGQEEAARSAAVRCARFCQSAQQLMGTH